MFYFVLDTGDESRIIVISNFKFSYDLDCGLGEWTKRLSARLTSVWNVPRMLVEFLNAWQCAVCMGIKRGAKGLVEERVVRECRKRTAIKN